MRVAIVWFLLSAGRLSSTTTISEAFVAPPARSTTRSTKRQRRDMKGRLHGILEGASVVAHVAPPRNRRRRRVSIASRLEMGMSPEDDDAKNENENQEEAQQVPYQQQSAGELFSAKAKTVLKRLLRKKSLDPNNTDTDLDEKEKLRREKLIDDFSTIVLSSDTTNTASSSGDNSSQNQQSPPPQMMSIEEKTQRMLKDFRTLQTKREAEFQAQIMEIGNNSTSGGDGNGDGDEQQLRDELVAQKLSDEKFLQEYIQSLLAEILSKRGENLLSKQSQENLQDLMMETTTPTPSTSSISSISTGTNMTESTTPPPPLPVPSSIETPQSNSNIDSNTKSSSGNARDELLNMQLFATESEEVRNTELFTDDDEKRWRQVIHEEQLAQQRAIDEALAKQAEEFQRQQQAMEKAVRAVSTDVQYFK